MNFSKGVALLFTATSVWAAPVAEQTCDAGSPGCAVGSSMLLQSQQKLGKTQLDCRKSCAGNVKKGLSTWEAECQESRCLGCPECSTTTTTTPTATTVPPTTAPATTAPRWPHEVMACPTTAAKKTASMTCADYDAVVASIRALYDGLDSSCEANHCPQADWAGCVLRIAGHDLMDYKDGQGGSDGCLDFYDHDNKGLAECLYTGDHGKSVLDAYKHHCSSISLADFIVIAAEAVMTISREHVLSEDPARSAVDFRSKFRFGRETVLECTFTAGRLPNPERSCTAVNETFVQSMGLDWAGAAALMGVHTLGKAQIANSGYDGFWSDAENSRRFNNNYYASILGKGWMAEKAVNGNTNKNQWVRRDEGRADATLGKEMMLDTDLCLAFTQDDDGLQDLAASEGCCAWVSPRFIAGRGETEGAIDKYLDGEFCGSMEIPGAADFKLQRAKCCDGQTSAKIDCGLPNEPRGPAFESVKDFANDEDKWLSAFSAAWTKSTENGHAGLKSLESCSP